VACKFSFLGLNNKLLSYLTFVKTELFFLCVPSFLLHSYDSSFASWIEDFEGVYINYIHRTWLDMGNDLRSSLKKSIHINDVMANRNQWVEAKLEEVLNGLSEFIS